MPSFPKPSFPFNYNVPSEVTALRHDRDTKPGRRLRARLRAWPGRFTSASQMEPSCGCAG